MQTAWRAATLLLVTGAIAGAVYLIVPDRTDSPLAVVKENLKMSDKFKLTSSAFENGETIPSKHTCDEDNLIPELTVSGTPEGTVSFALIVDDPDIPQEIKDSRGIEKFVHWVRFNIPGGDDLWDEDYGPLGLSALNGAGELTYRGPCPPPEYEPTEHRYFFKLFALDTTIALDEGTTLEEVEKAMEGHIISQTELVGLYDRATSTDSE